MLRHQRLVPGAEVVAAPDEVAVPAALAGIAAPAEAVEVVPAEPGTEPVTPSREIVEAAADTPGTMAAAHTLAVPPQMVTAALVVVAAADDNSFAPVAEIGPAVAAEPSVGYAAAAVEGV